HFRRRYFSAFDIGWKSLAVNISDVGSSGAKPTGFSIGLTLTGKEDTAWLEGFCEGMKALTDRFDLAISGGDLARSSLLNVCVTAWGELSESLPRGLRRGVAQEGDVIFLVGNVGLARLGLTALEASDDAEACTERWPAACSQHLRPMPLASEGMALGRFAVEHGLQDRLGLMDVSDGLARDLPRLMNSRKSGLGADIVLDAVHQEVQEYCAVQNLDAAQFAFEGGEDYALAGTCPAEAWPALEALLSSFTVPFSCLGRVRPGAVTLNGAALVSAGFDHFSA
ncbi:MAG: thiamine-phosphate kinase, partial [Mailhella sp.]|nr:thiamine-phosphate kinase [Mailhella sp.]